MEFLVILLIVALYFLPSLNAYGKRNKNRGTVLVLNFFLGWTFLGWVIALAMSASSDIEQEPIKEIQVFDEYNCPFCHELIKSKAKICRFCQKELPPPKKLGSEDSFINSP